MSAGSRSAFGAGVAAAAAILTRPNLAPLAPIVAASVALSAPRLRRLAAFAAPVAAGCLLVATFNAALYGSPVLSGYGPLGALFSWANGGPNIRAYARWMNDLYSPAILLALAAPWLYRRGVVWLMLAFAAGVALSYLFYVPFGDWPFARFLLPAVPLLLVMTGAAVVAGIERLPPAFGAYLDVMSGSHFPLFYLESALGKVREAGLPAAVWDEFTANARALLPRP